MKQLFYFTFLLLPILGFPQSSESYFLTQPSLSPDGQTVVFSFEGDLWKANIGDGQGMRLTAMPGYESDAKISPDGKWIAFTGRQYGNPDVFVMPLTGGDIKQLTWYSGPDQVSSWSWDSKSIYFVSQAATNIGSYKVDINGGTPVKIFPDYYFLYDHGIVEHPTTGELFFNDTWESTGSQIQRKRYKGPFNPDIQSYDLKTKKYKRYTDWIGKDFGTTIDRRGIIYFISDEANGEYNLYTLDNDKKTALTHFNSSIKSPNVNANGDKVVFEKDYQLWIYDVASKNASKIKVNIVRNNVLGKEKDFEVRAKISNYDISPDGKKIVFVSRGELFVSDIEGKFIQQISRASAERVSEVEWLSDNKTILFNQTLGGFQNLYTISADGKGQIKQITKDQANNRSIVMNSKKTMAIYLSGRNELRLLDTKTLESKLLVKDEFWGFESSDPAFAPNDEWVVYGAYRNFETDLFAYNIKENKSINLTNTGISEVTPLWGPDGKYIYYISSRLYPSYPTGLRDPKIYRLPLLKYDDPYLSNKFDELFKEEKKDQPKGSTDKDDKKDEKKDPKSDSAKSKTEPMVIKIDPDNMMDRVEQIGPGFGAQYLQNVFKKDDKTTVLYVSNQGEGKQALYKTVLESFENPKTEKITGSEGFCSSIIQRDNKYYLLLNGTIQKLNLDGNKLDPINMNYTFRRNLSEEFDQMFYEAWAQLEENYYDEHFHGLDWNKTKDYYKQFLPYLNNRNDLRTLLNDMLGELNSSHQGFFSGGDDEKVQLSNSTMETGIIFDNDKPYTVKYILRKSPADKSDIDLLAGDVLTKVDGIPVNESIDRYYYFTKPSMDKEMRLGFRRADKEFSILVHPQDGIRNQLYDRWIDNNQARVDQKSNKRIAYACMKNMGPGEYEHFVIEMTKQLINRDGLILDLRYNTGGNVHDQVLNFLRQKSYLQWKYRQGKLTRQPNFSPSDKPIVLLINEQSLSDAEMTSQGFKALKLGKIIGNETYHWIIFTSGAGLVDGSFVRLPSWGCYTLEGKDLEFNGVSPDIRVVNTFEDKISGKDPQLDKAIEEIMAQLK
jgi:C-terminal processing protease CtpA/Prc/Tol biopolymer transport system component